ncbi:MAG: 50S ribosomal protein L18 [Patescibacteria group bacterium]
MSRLQNKVANLERRKQRIRAKLYGTAKRPRLTVSISNMHVSAQLIDDEGHKTLAQASTVGLKATGTMTERAKLIGTEIAKKAKTAKISTAIFDRNGRLYHGRIKALADAARENGLKF